MPTDPALPREPPPDRARDQRSKILATALELMSTRGSAATSMRQLATACGLNVATIYHYFPSKADLLRAVIEERRYSDRLASELPPVDLSMPVTDRLRLLLSWLWEQTQTEQQVLRLIVGEGTHGDETARESARALIVALDDWLVDVLQQWFPEVAERRLDPVAVALVVRRHLLGLVAEGLAAGPPDGQAAAQNLAHVLFPNPAPAAENEHTRS